VDLKATIADDLDCARRRSLDLLAPLDDAALVAQHSSLMSPLIWDLAHIGNYEDLWLLRALGADAVGAHLDALYNAFENPRFRRGDLPFLRPAAARRYIGEVRERALDVLDRVDLEVDDPLRRAGYVYAMVVQHEHQHDETMLAALQLRTDTVSGPALDGPFAREAVTASEVFIPAGKFTMGTDVDPWAYDNERPAHIVDLPAFWIDTTPVTNRAYLEFVLAGGYNDARWWTPAGWSWRMDADATAPQYWHGDSAGGMERIRFGRVEALPMDEPVQHVCWFEADAYARFRGRRLPTEVEWEKAAAWDPVAGRSRRYPWGDDPPTPERANLGQQRWSPMPVGALPEGASASGCRQMLGDVWEWTASDFRPYPGYGAFPYREYSEVFFGSEYKVLRGGSWATDPRAARTTFRNWDFPIRRQIFAGFRCARDDGP